MAVGGAHREVRLGVGFDTQRLFNEVLGDLAQKIKNGGMGDNVLLDHATDGEASELLVRYLTTYSGRLFDKWARPDLSRFVFDDIVAVKALSVEVPAEAADQILSDRGGHFARLLGELGKFTLDDHLYRWVPQANELHQRLTDLHDVAGVKAGKLMHAKLPELIPIWDDKTQKGLKYEPGQYWSSWHREYTPAVLTAVEDLRRSVPAAQTLDDLRILDIVIWMKHEGD